MYKIDIKGPIVSNTVGFVYHWFGWDACCPKDVIDGLKKANGEDVVLEINSTGGVCVYGYEMYTAIMEYEGNVEAHVINAMSAASLPVCAADKALASDTAIFMIHNASSSASGDYRSMNLTADELNEYDAGIINAYVRKTGKSREELQLMMDAESYMSPQKAIENGFIDDYMFGDPNAAGEKKQKEKITNVGNAIALNATIPVMTEEQAQAVIAKIKCGDVVGEIDPSVKNDTLKPAIQGIGQTEIMKSAAEIAVQMNSDIGEVVNTQNCGEKTTSDKLDVNQKKEGEKNMTLQEFLDENPDAQNEVDTLVSNAREEGVKAERARIEGLDSIANSVTEEKLSEAKYGEEPIDAKTLAFNALKDDGIKASAYMDNAKDDSKESGVENVGCAGTDEDDPMDESDDLASHVNARKGGK